MENLEGNVVTSNFSLNVNTGIKWFQGTMGAWLNHWHWVRGRLCVGHGVGPDTNTQTFTITSSPPLLGSPINLTCMSLDCLRKLVRLERSHAGTKSSSESIKDTFTVEYDFRNWLLLHQLIYFSCCRERETAAAAFFKHQMNYHSKWAQSFRLK